MKDDSINQAGQALQSAAGFAVFGEDFADLVCDSLQEDFDTATEPKEQQ